MQFAQESSRKVEKRLAWKSWGSFVGMLYNILNTYPSHPLLSWLWGRRCFTTWTPNSFIKNRHTRRSIKWRQCSSTTWRIRSFGWKRGLRHNNAMSVMKHAFLGILTRRFVLDLSKLEIWFLLYEKPLSSLIILRISLFRNGMDHMLFKKPIQMEHTSWSLKMVWKLAPSMANSWNITDDAKIVSQGDHLDREKLVIIKKTCRRESIQARKVTSVVPTTEPSMTKLDD